MTASGVAAERAADIRCAGNYQVARVGAGKVDASSDRYTGATESAGEPSPGRRHRWRRARAAVGGIVAERAAEQPLRTQLSGVVAERAVEQPLRAQLSGG
jgi:hypothetical protein